MIVVCSLYWDQLQSSLFLVQHVTKHCSSLKIVIWDIFRFEIILGHFFWLRNNFWVGQKVDGTGKIVLVFLKSPFHGLSNSR